MGVTTKINEVKNYNDLTKELGKAGDMVVVIYMYDEVPMRNTIFEMEVMARDHSNVKFLKGAINECEQFASLSGDKYLPTFIYMKNGQPLDPYEYTKMNIQAVLANCSKKGPANDGIKTEVTAIKDSSDNEEDTNEKEGIVEE